MITFTVHDYPLSWYAGKLLNKDPFAYLSYGDGEWLVATGMCTGKAMQAGEVITPKLENETRASLELTDPRIVRGTDPNLLRWREYKGGDAAGYRELGVRLDILLAGLPDEAKVFTDGVVFERACWEGKLSPLVQALRSRSLVLVGNERLRGATFLRPRCLVTVPDENAVAALDDIEYTVVQEGGRARDSVVVVCSGLGATPLIARLLPKLPETTTYLDLGSTFDVFVGLGASRGWRAELYAEPQKLAELVSRNLEGV